MRKGIWTLLCTLALLTLTGCGEKTPEVAEQPEEQMVEYSSLSDTATREELDALMEEAGITESRREQFFRHVDQINALLTPEEQTAGMETLPANQPKYDPYDLLDRWNGAYPDFLGYNCRITAYSLFGDFVRIPEGAETRTDMLTLDLEALRADDSAFPGQEERFSALFSTVPTGDSLDPAVHEKTWLEDWKNRGITFTDDPKVRLISVVFHNELSDGHFLFVGHAGLLFPQPDGELWFLEKISFQEPYQLVHLKDREELYRYLMGKYDLDENQPLAPPFILENDRLMEKNCKES